MYTVPVYLSPEGGTASFSAQATQIFGYDGERDSLGSWGVGRMLAEHERTLGLALRDEADKHFTRMLLFGSILLFLHLLGVNPSEVDAAGLKFKIADPSILYGGVALIFLHYAFRAMSLAQRGESFLRLQASTRIIRSAILMSRKTRKNKSIDKIKKGARLDLATHNVVMTPYYLTVTCILFFALAAAAVDVYLLCEYFLEHSPILSSDQNSIQ